jgi:transcriptional regulator with XRE-family HTH domain
VKIESYLTDQAFLEIIGERLAGLRLAQNLTQEQLATQAGLGVRTIQRLESGAAATQLSGFIRVCRELGLLERFDSLVPEAVASPMARLKREGRTRQRATGTKRAESTPKKWTWGDEK